MTFEVRKAISADVAGILRCLAEAFEHYRESYTRQAFLDTVLTPETLARRLKSTTVLVAVTQQVGMPLFEYVKAVRE